MTITVKKFGGTSVGSTDRIKAVAQRVLQDKNGSDGTVIVVSAMGGTTDTLVKLAKEMSPKPNLREYDALVSTGENVSAALLSMAIQDLGHDAISLNGSQAGIVTEDLHSKAKILSVAPDRIMAEIRKGKIVIITGFQGRNRYEDITTIGRGGSDTSAVVLAAAVGAKVCEIYTDVDGIYTTDPRVVNGARKLNQISYDEMLELATLGAKVLHPRAVETAKENNIEIHVRSSFNASEGTRVREEKDMEVKKPVTGAVIKEKEAIISILHVEDKPGIASTLFSKLAEHAVNIDMIIQSEEQDNSNSISFTVSGDDLDEAKAATDDAAKELNAVAVKAEQGISKISIVGVGMISKPGIAAKMFRVLADNNINIKLISTSEIKISCAVAQEDGRRALTLLHEAFELDKDG